MRKCSHGTVFKQDREYAELLFVFGLVTDKLLGFFNLK